MADRYKDRLKILEDREIEELYGRPQFNPEERVHFFSLTPEERAVADGHYNPVRDTAGRQRPGQQRDNPIADLSSLPYRRHHSFVERRPEVRDPDPHSPLASFTQVLRAEERHHELYRRGQPCAV